MGKTKSVTSLPIETARSVTQISSRQSISEDEYRRMVAEAAYYRAMHRGFNGGDPLDDWLVAEREINRSLPVSARVKG